MKFGALVFTVILIGGCVSNSPSHLPSPLELPGSVIGTIASNSIYNARRKTVKKYILSNYEVLSKQVLLGNGEELTQLFSMAKVFDKRKELLAELLRGHENYFLNKDAESIERLTVTVMVYSN